MSAARLVRTVAARAFRTCVRLLPAGMRRAHADELVDAFGAELDRRLGGGALRVAAYAVRACADVVWQGWRERLRGWRPLPGHGAPTRRREGVLAGLSIDVRLAARGVRRARGFTAAATLVLALGIGANASVFGALRVAVLAPPPYPDAERLVVVDLTVKRSEDAPREPMIWSYPKFLELLELAPRSIDRAAGYAARSATLTEAGPAEVVQLELVSPGYFSLVGRQPVLGRGFTPQELGPEQGEVAVLSQELWRTRFGADPEILGRDVVLNGARLTVVGLAPDGFDGLTGGARLWVPMAAARTVFSPFMVESPDAHWFHVLGRLADDASVEEARAEMRSLGDAIAEAYPAPNPRRTYSGTARSLTSVRTNETTRTSLLALTAAAALVLLVACANLSGLLLARARRTARDGAVRVAVGASRWRLVRASLVESVMLAALGGGAGVLLALGGTRAMAAAWPQRFLRGAGGDLRAVNPEQLGVDATVLAFAALVTLATALVFGIGPALWASRADVQARLRDGSGATRRERRVLGLDARAALVGAQVGLALVLVIGTGLVGSSTLRLLEVDEGFRTERLVTFGYTIPLTNPRTDDPLPFHEEFVARIERLGSVTAATFGCAPLRGHCIITAVDAIEGAPEIPRGDGLEIGVRMVDDDHFADLGIPVVRGRVFDRRDGVDAQPTVVISELAAARLFPGQDPIGRRIELGIGSSGKGSFSEVIGVVGDVLYNPPDQGLMAEAYFSMREYPENHGNVTVRTEGDPLAVVPQIRAVLADIDPTIAIFRVQTMDEIIVRSVGDRRATVGLLALFALVTVLLAATGTWGIVSYTVAAGRRELGLRLALGAGEGRVLRGVLGGGVRTAALGIALGLLGGGVMSGLVESLLWQTERTDPRVYGGGAALLFAVVLLASWIPARRATRVDPVEALRAE